MRIFDTNVQEIKYKVLREVAKLAFEDGLDKGILDIPEIIIPGPEANMRCCIYKERAIVNERIKLAMGGDENNQNVIEVLNIACDECPITQFIVTEACRGCIAHRCESVCPKGAITMINHKAHIDHSKCIACGRCLSVCPYTAIIKLRRPCENACKVNAIKMDENKKAQINNEKCIACGACVYQCPFGAIMDKSYILKVIDLLKESKNEGTKVYAVVAPSISGQFNWVKLGQVVSGLKQLGFHSVVEAALGADMVAFNESKEWKEKGFLTSSCCPAFVNYIKGNLPEMVEHVSHNLSPMAEIANYIKQTSPDSKVVFIGPCIAKKEEAKREEVNGAVDAVITFEELLALFDGRKIVLEELPEAVLDNASYYGRIFARSGGLADAVRQALKEQNLDGTDFSPISCSGIEECKIALLKASKGILEYNFIEGMACNDGCIGGAACLTHGKKDRMAVDEYGQEAKEKTIKDAISILNIK